MSTKRTFLCATSLLAAATLAGCGGGATGSSAVVAPGTAETVATTFATTGKFVIPTGSGAIYAGLSSSESGSDVDIEGDGYAYQVGALSENAGFSTVAGLVGGNSLAALPTTGEATYSGSYEVILLNRNSPSDSTAMVKNYASDMTLTANLTDQTFSGIGDVFTETSEGRKPMFYTKGEISNGQMDGLVRFRRGQSINIRADMVGAIGANKTIGAFQGTDGVDAVAGGFHAIAD